MKVSLDTKFAPGTGRNRVSRERGRELTATLSSGAKSGSLKTEYKHEAAMVTADMDLAFSAINASAVVGQKVLWLILSPVSIVST